MEWSASVISGWYVTASLSSVRDAGVGDDDLSGRRDRAIKLSGGYWGILEGGVAEKS